LQAFELPLPVQSVDVDGLGLGEMNLLHKMRLLEEHGKMFGKTELGAMHTMGMFMWQ